MPLPPRLTGFGQVSFCVQAKARFLFVRMESSADVSTSIPNDPDKSEKKENPICDPGSYRVFQLVLWSSRHCRTIEFLRASYGVCERG